MKWKNSPIIKIYEALGAVADGRVHVIENTAKVYSSSGNKYYDVSYDPSKQEIMANDNGSFWKGYLGYPSIAFLMKIGVLGYDERLGSLLRDFAWKDINQKFKNDFDKTLEFILSSKAPNECKALEDFAGKTIEDIKKLDLGQLGKRMAPPEGY